MSEHKEPIPSMIYNASVGGHVTNSQQIIDENLNREQQDINEEVAAVPYNATTPNGMGKIVLKKNDNFKQIVEAQTNGNTIFIIKYDFILTDNVTIPANCVLEFNGGSVSGNGTGKDTVTGNNTNIIAPKSTIFYDVVISGTWICPVVYSNWFNFDLTGQTDNLQLIRNLGNMSSDNNDNIIIFDDGIYYGDVSNETPDDDSTGKLISIKSNTTLIINGILQIFAGNRTHYNCISCIGKKNIIIEGKGKVVGDVATHTGTTGEWGHGIDVTRAENILIRDIKISHCWGDGIYVGGNASNYPKKIKIDGVKITNCRRQGISIISVDDLLVSNTIIGDTGTPAFTAPGYDIDIEPDDAGHLTNIVFDGLISKTSKGLLFVGTSALYGCSIINSNIVGITINDNSIGSSVEIINSRVGTFRISDETVANKIILRNSKVENCSSAIKLSNYGNGKFFVNFHIDGNSYSRITMPGGQYSFRLSTRGGFGGYPSLGGNETIYNINRLDSNTIHTSRGITKILNSGYGYPKGDIRAYDNLNVAHSNIIQNNGTFEIYLHNKNSGSVDGIFIIETIAINAGYINYIKYESDVTPSSTPDLKFLPENNVYGPTVDIEANIIPQAGVSIFDSTRGKMIVHNGTNWVNVDGSPLS